ncbi:hypothetical protein DMC47_32035 [Nostoc sp. 3335mG]|nr:hypothetical protein DMC47_32035 [Nostoc sp. 3335mG]
MRISMPKPLHGWRAFLGEVGIIVLGVLLALAAGQIVEEWQWHRKVGAIRNSLTNELANDRARWEWDVGSTRCAIGQIDTLNRWIIADKPTALLPDTSAIDARAMFFWMHTANWGLASSSDALDHFPVDEQLSYATLYDGIAHRQVEMEKITDLMAQIDTLLPFANDRENRRTLQLTLAGLKTKLFVLTTDAGYMRRRFDALGIKPDQSDFAADIATAGCRPTPP